MARQGTAKQAIDAQNGVTPPVTPPVAPTTPTPINTPAPVTAPPITPPTAPAQPRVEGQWNYGTADNQVLGANPTVAPTQPTPTVKPASASQAIAQGFKQEIKPVVAKAQPLTTEIGREAKLGQLPTVQQAQNQAEQDRINTSNLKSQSGQQLWSNLESISSTNTSLLNDRKAFDQAFGYDGKDVSEKALVDAFWKSKRLDANSIYNSLATGTTIPNESKNTPAFTDALIRHQDTTRFENLNPYQLSKVINTELIPGTQTYNDLMAKNPQLVTDAMKLASINAPVTARQETTNWQDNLSNYLSRSPVMSNPTTVATIMNSDPNIATKTNEVQAVEDKLTEAKDRLKNIQKNVTERYKGTGATKQTVNAKALAESQDIIDEITMLEANKASASSALTTLIQNAKDNYTYARQDRQDALDQYNQGFQQLQALADMGMKQDSLAYQQQKDATERDLGLLQYYTNIDQANAKEARGYNFQEQSDLRNFEQSKELAKMGYQNQYNLSNLGFNQDMAKLGMQQSYDTNKMAKQNQLDMIKSLVAKNIPYDKAVAQVMGTGGGMSIDRQTAISQYGSTPVRNFNPGNITDTGFGGQKVAGERFTQFNSPQEGFNALVSKIQNIQAGGSKVYSPTMSLLQYINKYAPASDNNNPTAYANGIAKNLGISPNTQLKDIDPNALAMEHAKHEDGNMYKMLQDLGINGKQTVQPTQATTTQPTGYEINGKSFQESDVEVLAEIRDVLAKTPTEGRKMLTEYGYDMKDIAALNNDKLPKTGTQKKGARDIMYQIQDIAKMDWNDATGLAAGLPSFSGGDAETANTKIEAIISKLALPNLGLLKGPMSDKDLAFISSASANLKPTQSDESFEKRLLEYYNWNAGISGLKKAETLKDIQDANIYGVIPEGSQSNAPVDNRFSELYSQLK